MNKKVTSIKDIAEIVGVSPSTVSRVLNKTGRYSKKTEEKILQVVEQYGFVYNMSAKSLKNSRSNSIGLLIPDITNDFYSSLALMIERFFKERNYSVYICNSGDNPDDEYSYLTNLASNQVDGIICISLLTSIPKSYKYSKIPIITLDREPLCDFAVPSVCSDDFTGGYQATEHLIQKGCKKIIHLANSLGHMKPTKQGISRVTGYKQAMLDHGLESYVVTPEFSAENALFDAEKSIHNLIKNGIEFDGIFAGNDRYALGVIYALQYHGISVPETVKVIGYDNSLYSSLSRPAISTIARNAEVLAANACQCLWDIMQGNREMHGEKILIPTHLIERKSTE